MVFYVCSIIRIACPCRFWFGLISCIVRLGIVILPSLLGLVRNVSEGRPDRFTGCKAAFRIWVVSSWYPSRTYFGICTLFHFCNLY
jgi:hypothetical protein